MRTRRFILWAGVILTLAVAALGLVSAARRIAAFQPLGFAASRAGGGWLIGSVSARPTGLLEGDLLVFVAGAEPADRADLTRRLRLHPESEVLVLRGEAPLTLTYRRPPLDIDFAYLLLVLSGAASLAVGLYTIGRAPQDRGARLFFLWSVATAAVYLISHPLGYHFDDLARLGFGVEEICRILLAPLTVHLFLVFPGRRDTDRGPAWWPFLYAPAAALSFAQLDLMLGRGWLIQPTRSAIQSLDGLTLVHLVVGAAVAVLTLLIRGRRLVGAEPRRQAAWIAAGLTVGYVPFLLAEVLPRLVGLSVPQLVRVAGVLPLSLVPLAFAWAILRYRLWDLGLMVRDGVAAAVTVVLGGSTFALLQLAIDRHLPGALTETRPLISAVAGLLTAGLLVPTQRGVRRRLERVIHLDRLEDRRALGELGRSLLAEHDPEQLEQRLVDALRDGLGVDEVLVLLRDGEEFVDRAGRFRFDGALLAGIWERSLFAIGPGVPGDPASPAHAELFAAGLRYGLPLRAREDHIGVLALGYRQGELPLSSEDLEIVAGLTAPVALALENAHLLSALAGRLEQVQQLTKRSENIINSSPAGIALLDQHGVVQHANDTLRSVVGGNPVGRSLEDLFPVPLPAVDSGSGRVSFTDDGGTERHFEMARSRSQFDGAQQDILVVQDVGERIAMERQLVEQERLAALGMLAAGVAHEVNTPLTGISSYAQMLLAQTGEDDSRRDLLLKVERQTFRAARIVRDLLELARDRSDSVAPVDIHGVVRESLDLLNHRSEQQGVEVRIEGATDLPRVNAAPVELDQIFTNLFVNALDAMATGGRLEVTLRAASAQVLVVVRDTGEGIAPEALAKIFQPFYSTKVGRGGSGLGLAITHQLVTRLGGEIAVHSELGCGTSFELTLPAVGDQVH